MFLQNWRKRCRWLCDSGTVSLDPRKLTERQDIMRRRLQPLVTEVKPELQASGYGA